MNVILIGGPGHGEHYHDVPDHQEVVVLEHADVPAHVKKIKVVDRTEYRRSGTVIHHQESHDQTRCQCPVAFTVVRGLPGKIVNAPSQIQLP